MSVPFPLMSGAIFSRNLGFPAFGGNPASYVQADGNRIMSSALAGPVLGALMGQKSSASFSNSNKADPPLSSH